MKKTTLLVLSGLLLFTAACGAPATTTTPESSEPDLVIADSNIISEGRLEPIRYAELALNASGLVSDVLLSEGDAVNAGDVIARLEADNAKTLEAAQAQAAQELTSAYQAVRDAQFKLDNFDVPNDFKGLTPSEAVEAMQIKLDKARADFEPYKNVDDKSLELTDAEQNNQVVITGTAKIYKRALDDAWADYRKAILWLELDSSVQNATSRLVLAQRDYDALQDATFSEDTAGARAALANAEVRAPFPGILTNLDLKVGEFATSGQPVATVADTTKWIVKTTDLTEIDVVSINNDEAVIVRLDAIPEIEFNGVVLSVSQNFSESQGDIVYEVTLLLAETDPAMRWGMTAEVIFGE